MTILSETKSKPSRIAAFFENLFPNTKAATREAEIIDTHEIYLGHHMVSRKWVGGTRRWGCQAVGVSADTKAEIQEAIRQYEYAKFNQQFVARKPGVSSVPLPKVAPKIQPVTPVASIEIGAVEEKKQASVTH